jgi:hypothetical protein
VRVLCRRGGLGSNWDDLGEEQVLGKLSLSFYILVPLLPSVDRSRLNVLFFLLVGSLAGVHSRRHPQYQVEEDRRRIFLGQAVDISVWFPRFLSVCHRLLTRSDFLRQSQSIGYVLFCLRECERWVANLFYVTGGEKYLEHVGTGTLTNHSTGDSAVLQFKEAGWGGPSSRNKVEGKLVNSSGTTVGELAGKWDEGIVRKKGRDSLQVLWQSHDLPRGRRCPAVSLPS